MLQASAQLAIGVDNQPAAVVVVDRYSPLEAGSLRASKQAVR